jgi:hypothetical protein
MKSNSIIVLIFILGIFVIAKSQRSPDIVKIEPNKALEQFMSDFNPKFIDSLIIVDKSLKFCITINDSIII